MERGEQSEAGGERLARIPLEQVPTEYFFEWAKEKQRYLARRLREPIRGQMLEEVVDQLEQYIVQHFYTSPEVEIQTRDTLKTVDTSRRLPLTQIIKYGPIPYMELEPTIYGHLYGFHVGETGDLRVHVDTGDQPVRFTGGVYSPLLSVGLEGSTVRFIEDTYDKEYKKADSFAILKINEHDDDTLNGLFMLFRSHLEDSEQKMMVRLKQSTEVTIQMIRRIKEKDAREELTDALWDMIRAKLELTVPYDIDASAHRLSRGKHGYKPAGPGAFTHVDLQMCLTGETDNPVLAFYFAHGEESIQVPLDAITKMQKSEV